MEAQRDRAEALERLLDKIPQAAARIRGRVHRTPLLSSRTLGSMVRAPVHLKAENLQKTGSFKVRGALHRVSTLTEEERRRGVVSVSAGNHAQALAWAAGAEQVPATLVMPASASQTKVDAVRAYGARALLHGDVFQAFEKALELERREGLVFVHPFDEPDVVAGQGTVGLEIAEDLQEVETVVVPVGGGGLLAGTAAALKGRGSGPRIVGVEPEGAASLHASLRAGRAVRLDRVDTVADGLAPPMAGTLALEAAEEWVDEVVLVTDDEIRDAMRFILSRAKLLTEPAGAAGVAGLLSGRITGALEGPVVAILSGGNVDPTLLREILAEPDPRG